MNTYPHYYLNKLFDGSVQLGFYTEREQGLRRYIRLNRDTEPSVNEVWEFNNHPEFGFRATVLDADYPRMKLAWNLCDQGHYEVVANFVLRDLVDAL